MKRGFTLIELLVVIAIIGLLASIVLASLSSARVKARDAKRFSDMRNIRTALDLYNLKNNTYPPSTPGPAGAGCWWSWEAGNTQYSGSWLSALVTDGEMPNVPQESIIGGCTYRYVQWQTNNSPQCGSNSGYAALYMLFESPTPPSCHPSCVSAWGWGEAQSGDPNGCLVILPQ